MYWTALPIRDAIWLCRRDDFGTTPVREIPSDDPEKEVELHELAVSELGYVAVFRGAHLHIVPPDNSLPVIVTLPDDLEEIHAVHFRGVVLYIGGRSSWQDTSRLGWIDVSVPEPAWTSLEPPSIVGDPSLPVYALFSRDRELIALDGSFTPKLALMYDIADPRAPRYVNYGSVASGIDDVPVDASIGRSYVAILTTSQANNGRAWKIGLFDASTMDEVATFYEHSTRVEAIEFPRRVLICEDLLLIAHDMKGLGAIRLDDRKETIYEESASIRPWAQSYVPVERIEYHKPLGQGRVVDVQRTDEPNVFYVVLQRGGRRWWEEIDIR